MKKILALIILIFLTSFTCPICKQTKQECIVAQATKEIGVREEGGNNKGQRVSEYLLNAGITTPAAWCSAFVRYILDACRIRNKVNAWAASATANNRIYDRRYPDKNTITPSGGDVFTLYYPNLNRIGHTGFIVLWDDKWVETIEGNTSEADTRETSSGRDGVFKKKRLKSSIYQVSRYY
jgi:hypothetical protein